jgi:hypothetical protein
MTRVEQRLQVASNGAPHFRQMLTIGISADRASIPGWRPSAGP